MEKENTEVKALRIKNGYIEKLVSFLDTPLNGVDARARNRFVKILGTQLIFLESERVRVLSAYSEKDDNHKPKMIENSTKYDITPDNLQNVQKE